MSNVPIPDANGNARKVDTFARTEGADTVETQAVAVVDPATGTPIDFATQATAAALLVAANAIKVAAEALNAKAVAINTGAIAGTVTANQGTMAALPAGANAVGDVGVQYRATATGAASGYHLFSANGTNAAIIKSSAGRVLGWHLSNLAGAARFVKLHNQSILPTAGANVSRTIALPFGGSSVFSLEGGIAFSSGIGITIVAEPSDNGVGSIGIADIVGEIYFA